MGGGRPTDERENKASHLAARFAQNDEVSVELALWMMHVNLGATKSKFFAGSECQIEKL